MKKTPKGADEGLLRSASRLTARTGWGYHASEISGRSQKCGLARRVGQETREIGTRPGERMGKLRMDALGKTPAKSCTRF